MSYNQTPFGRLGALGEILGVFFVGAIIGSLLMQAAGITGHPLTALLADNPDMIAISWQTAKVLLLQYAGWILFALLFTLAQKRHIFKDRGLTLGGKSWLTLIILGVGAWALGDMPNKVMWILEAEFDIGTSVPWREALFSAERTAGWWLLMAVGSFGLIPLLEELFWRGYVQSRLQESFSPTTALVITAAMFTFSHAQYHQMDLFHISTVISVFFGSLILGWIFQKTGSLVPAIIMHAILNFPTEGVWAYVILAAMTVIVAKNWGKYNAAFSEAYAKLRASSWGMLETASAIIAVAAMLGLTQAPQFVPYAGYIGFPLAIITTIWARRKLPAT